MAKSPTMISWPAACRGFSLFEALVTAVVVSIGLLGLAGLQFTGLRAVNDAYERTLAMHITQDVVERLRANRDGVNGGLYNAVTLNNTSPDPGGNCYNTACNTAQGLFNYDATQWLALIKTTPLLTNLKIQIQRPLGAATFTVTVTWGNADAAHTLVTHTSALL